MLRVNVHAESGAAKSYYSSGEYYAAGLELAGEWGGRGAATLGLAGQVDRRAFDALCDNLDPKSFLPLTQRTKAHRRVLFDFNFHVPKTVSIVFSLLDDGSILRAFHAAVQETMAEVEADVRTRVRKGGEEDTRQTGNIVYARFVHTTARPVDGIPDPHLHAHCCVFNATFDPAERAWKAAELGDVYPSLPYYEAAFHARLARSLHELGFDVAPTKAGWEISGIPARVLKAFSRRTEQIEALARTLGLTDPKAIDRLGAKTRERKRRNLSFAALRAEWFARLTPAEWQALRAVAERRVPVAKIRPFAADEALAWAVDHVFEREAVVRVRVLLAAALRRGVGQVTVGGLTAGLQRHDLIVRNEGREPVVTTKPVLVEELEMLRFARSGRNQCRPLVPGAAAVNAPHLGPDQHAAVRHLLTSPDRVILLRGAAGTGKTALMKAAVGAIEAAGTRVIPLAPSAAASRGVLREEGFPGADTVARFMSDGRWQVAVRGQLLWIDEAGLLGTRTVARIFRLAQTLDLRVVLSGDVRQHGPVERGLPLRLLQTDAGLTPAEVNTVRRQRGEYKALVRLLSDGRVTEAFDRLTTLGWVHELDDGQRNEALAAAYRDWVGAGKSALVVAPTHAEAAVVSGAVRAALRASGGLTSDDRVYTRLEPRNWTVAERNLSGLYQPGDVVEFHARARGCRASVPYVVVEAAETGVYVRDPGGAVVALPLQAAERFAVYEPRTLALAVGDRVRVTKNGWSAGRGKRLDNGHLDTVVGFTFHGDIELGSGAVIPPGFGHLDHGYAVTSVAAQGKTVDGVFLALSCGSFPAVGREQFYVSVSRGRQQVTVFTDDRAALRQAVTRSAPKVSATEALRERVPGLSRWESWLLRHGRPIRRPANGPPDAANDGAAGAVGLPRGGIGMGVG